MKRFTLLQKTLMVVVSAALVGLVFGLFGIGPFSVFFKILSDDDEAPIIVRNGSMDLEIPSAHAGEWQNNNNGAWSYETPADKVHDNNFWVRVDLNNGSQCRGTGHVVNIDYSVTSFHAIFTPGGGLTGSTVRSQITPKSQIDYVDAQHLRHGAKNDGGHIKDVTVDGQSVKNGQADCGITQTNLVQVNICSNPNKCQ